MQFCDACRNMMMVVSSADGQEASYRCPCCSNQKDIPKDQTHLLRDRKPQDDYALYSRFLNKDIAKDPALPRAPQVACPFCNKKGGVLYAKYHPKKMRYIYHCELCTKFWKRSDEGTEALEPI